jgi:SAM-dependent methyltransferase
VNNLNHSAPDSPAFDAWYYASSCGRPYQRDEHWLGFFRQMADRIVADFQPRRVLDAGCALGLLVEALRERGVEAFGVDVSAFAIAHAHESIRPFCWQGSLTGDLKGEYDLIVAIEVLEHMTAEDGRLAIADICQHTRDVLFSSSPLDYREATHVNVQPPEYWAEQFARHGFHRDVDFDASFVTSWAVRFTKSDRPLLRLVSDYERRFSRLMMERNELRARAIEVQAELARLTELEAAAVSRLPTLQTALAAAEQELVRTQQVVAAMERSWFWKARRAWVLLSRWLGRQS